MEATKRFFHGDITVWTSSSSLRPRAFFLLFLSLNLLLLLCRCPLTDARDPALGSHGQDGYGGGEGNKRDRGVCNCEQQSTTQ
jgi:hypothetical protein